MLCHRSPVRVVTLGFASWIFCAGVDAQVDKAHTPIPMRIELILDSPTCIVHENFAFRMRVVNPNDFPVIIPGINLDYYVEPTIYWVRDDQEDMVLRNEPTVNPWTRFPIIIAAGQALEIHRFLWHDQGVTLRWPGEPGVYMLQPQFNVQVRLEADGEWYPIAWDRPIAEVRVLPMGPLDRRAWAWLEPRLRAYDEWLRNPKPSRENVGVEKVRIYGEFLKRFPDCTYARAIRWETAKLLARLLGNDAIEGDAVAKMVDLFEECFTFCLKQGGAYAEEFLEWNMDRGGNRAMSLGLRYRKYNLVRSLLSALDERDPGDRAASGYRWAILSGYEQSAGVARTQLARLIRGFPKSQYAAPAQKLIDAIDRGAWPPKPPDEQMLLYEAAGRSALAGDVPKAREMIKTYLQRFPNGRYVNQARALLKALDDGSWPPMPYGTREDDAPNP
ncbi:MAG: hypothetical protein D6690_10040 [Nitrospirae bacterium]|nr:MAG: hypothetical protein D6690_10040 [Nitrospirota bacterium]